MVTGNESKFPDSGRESEANLRQCEHLCKTPENIFLITFYFESI